MDTLPDGPSWQGPPADFVRDFLEAVRRIRFQGSRAKCPSCGHPRYHRWGSFAGRQRYRCLGCRRTFSDLTGTPLAYTKHLALWEPYVLCLIGSLSVRKAGRMVGVHRNTAFRWRHRLLAAHREREHPVLTGEVEIIRIRLPYSRKGRMPPRSGGRFEPAALGSADPEVARDLLCHVRKHDETWEIPIGRLSGFRSPPAPLLRDLLLPWIVRPSVLLAEPNPYLDLGDFCRREGLGLIWCAPSSGPPPRVRWRLPPSPAPAGRSSAVAGSSAGASAARPGAPRPEPSTHRVQAYVRRFRSWLDRFHGVTYRYLPNYFSWHRMLQRLGGRPTERLEGRRSPWDPGPSRHCCRRILLAVCGSGRALVG